MTTLLNLSFVRRSLGLALVAAGGILFAGCAESSHGNRSSSGNIGGDQVGGPDQTAGKALSGQVVIVSGTAVGAANDFALTNDSIAANFDAIGVDQAILTTPPNAIQAAVYPKGVALRTLMAPGGGLLADLGTRGKGNDQLPGMTQAFLGLVTFTAETTPAPVLNSPLANLVLNYDVIPDTDPRA
ncbi:MAG TPA: hypothetical protein VHF22_05660, partial [Planctomycetota bacterium]|nr:hypothetical protein [Planctomycetota bacterium]